MEKSDSINDLALALTRFQGEVTPIPFDNKVSVRMRRGGSYNFKYASLKSIRSVCRPLLVKHGLSVTQVFTLSGNMPCLVTMLMHASGQYISGSMPLYITPAGASTDEEPEMMNPQEIGSYITYMRRYAYTAILGLVSDEDDDGNMAEGNQVKKKGQNEDEDTTPEQQKPLLKKSTKDKLIRAEYKRAEDWMKKGGNIEDIEHRYRMSDATRKHLLSLKPD